MYFFRCLVTKAHLEKVCPREKSVFGYADDILALITARNKEEAHRKQRRVILRTRTLLDSYGLDLSRLMEVANSSMLYGSKIWAETLEVKKARKLTCIGTENGCIKYRVGISYSDHPSRTCDSRYSPCGSAGGRADEDL